MRRFRFSTLALLALGFASTAAADGPGVELAVYSGPAIPTYKQSFTFTGSAPQLQLARLTLKDSPSLDAEGGLSLGAGATFFLSNSFGLEVRADSMDVDLQSFGGNYTLELGPAGSPVSTLPVTLGAGETDLKRVRPWSLNLRVQSQGRVGFGLSGGVSYLSKVQIDAFPTVTVANLSASVPVSLIASPVDANERRHLGFNGGVTIQIKVAKGFAILAEGRGFAFKRSEFKWESKQTGSLSAIEQALLANIATQLEAPRFTPGFWTARAGVAFRF